MSSAMTVNKRFGVGFHLPTDAVDFAGYEAARTGIEHDVTPHSLGALTVIYDVAPVAQIERKAA